MSQPLDHFHLLSGKSEIVLDATITGALQGLLDSFPYYVMLVDENHRILLVNCVIINQMKLDSKQLIFKYCPKVIHGLDHPFPGCPLEEALAVGHSVERELFDSNNQRWVRSAVYLTRYRTQEGHAVYLHTSIDITNQKNDEKEIQINYQTQSILSEVLRMSLLDISLEELLNKALEKALSTPWIELEPKGCIFLVEENPKVLVLKTSRGLAPQLISACSFVPFGYCICGRAALSSEVVFTDRIDDQHETSYQGILPHGHYCAPITMDEKLLGVINLYLPNNHQRNKKEVDFLYTFSHALAGIIDRKRGELRLKNTVIKLREALGGIIQTTALIIEKRDPYTAGHQRRVSDLARAIADEMGLDKNRVDGIRLAGVIHDIGKISVPAEILSKPTQLNDLEYSFIRTHSQVGYDILKTIDFPWPIAQIVLQHHERINGSGYPSGLSGEEILLEARIISVADVVEAMSSHRPYRPSHGIEKALGEITRERGILYDSKVVDTCLKLFNDGYSFK